MPKRLLDLRAPHSRPCERDSFQPLAQASCLPPSVGHPDRALRPILALTAHLIHTWIQARSADAPHSTAARVARPQGSAGLGRRIAPWPPPLHQLRPSRHDVRVPRGLPLGEHMARAARLSRGAFIGHARTGTSSTSTSSTSPPPQFDVHRLSSPARDATHRNPPIPANVACQRCPIWATSLDHLALVQVGATSWSSRVQRASEASPGAAPAWRRSRDGRQVSGPPGAGRLLLDGVLVGRRRSARNRLPHVADPARRRGLARPVHRIPRLGAGSP